VGAAGSVVAPTANAAIVTVASGSLPAGEYEVRARGMYGGTADTINNMVLKKGAATLMTLSVNTAINSEPDMTILPRVTLDGSTALTINAVNAGAASTVYRAEIIATRTAD
jgi:hypothetical protein